ncbi:MAG TPA: cbb3-type cytochrome oxidase assembly protein CcoS [Steroidobacteraceae bacterium]|nr:cbb3-type cytochrome oxidase assembly protein CcoS [Steroidobacteraceae bacterium]
MYILFVLIPLSLVFVAGAVWAFFWAAESGQFDDLQSAGWDILLEDEPAVARTPTSSGQSSIEPTSD